MQAPEKTESAELGQPFPTVLRMKTHFNSPGQDRTGLDFPVLNRVSETADSEPGKDRIGRTFPLFTISAVTDSTSPNPSFDGDYLPLVLGWGMQLGVRRQATWWLHRRSLSKTITTTIAPGGPRALAAGRKSPAVKLMRRDAD